MIYWIWLQIALGYGYKNILPLLDIYKTAENIFSADANDLKFSGLLSERTLNKLCQKKLDTARKVLNICNERGILVIPITSEIYPENLKQITNPPIVLYAKGNTELLGDEPRVTIVGPREVSDFGKKAAFSLGARLAAGGITIVSGGAKGSDAAAHKGALAVGGNTICVLAVGIGDNYLIQNEQLRNNIAEKGLLLTEFRPGSHIGQYTFSIRNRIISGLSLGTVVIEADEGSGSLITASYAVEQSRDVFVIPGNPTYTHYKGSNALLRDGAKALLDANDVFLEYLPLYPHKINPIKAYGESVSAEDIANENTKKENVSVVRDVKDVQNDKNIQKIKKNITVALSKNAEMVYNQLDKPIFIIDDISLPSLSSAQIIAAITELEIYGYIKALPGGRYNLV